MTNIIAPQQEAILIEKREEASVIVPQKEAVIVEAQTEAAIITPQKETVIIEVVEQGPIGATGATGPTGPAGPAGDLPDGVNTGDIIRYNAATGAWETCAEPFEFQGIVLVPMVLPVAPVEGFLGYKAADNGLYVAVE